MLERADPEFDRAIAALHAGDTLVITTLDRLGRSTVNMLELADRLRGRGVALKVSNLGGDAVDTSTPIRSMLFTVMAALAQMELDIKREQINDSVSKRRAAGLDLGGRRKKFTRSQLDQARKLIDAGEPATHVARNLGMSRAILYRRLNTPPVAPHRLTNASSASHPTTPQTFNAGAGPVDEGRGREVTA